MFMEVQNECRGKFYNPLNETCERKLQIVDKDDRLASEPRTGHLNPLNPKTYQVFKNVICDVAILFPETFFHGEVDEIIHGCWKADPTIQSFLSNGGILNQILETFVNSTFPYILSLSHEAKLVLGGDVALWSEQVDPTVLDSRIRPRTSAMAETLWSRNCDDIGKKRDVEATDS
ncbi:hypothetical protein REPUB_Repub10bG0112300 [Reevesia pubescens]